MTTQIERIHILRETIKELSSLQTELIKEVEANAHIHFERDSMIQQELFPDNGVGIVMVVGRNTDHYYSVYHPEHYLQTSWGMQPSAVFSNILISEEKRNIFLLTSRTFSDLAMCRYDFKQNAILIRVYRVDGFLRQDVDAFVTELVGKTNIDATITFQEGAWMVLVKNVK